jgi:hypothetical protein
MQCRALPRRVWLSSSARRENVDFHEFPMSLRGVSGLGRGRFLKNLIYKHQAFNGLTFSWRSNYSNAVLDVV